MPTKRQATHYQLFQEGINSSGVEIEGVQGEIVDLLTKVAKQCEVGNLRAGVDQNVIRVGKINIWQRILSTGFE